MKKCSYCGAQMNDDSLFCTECGKPIPQGCVCPHCGASMNEGDVFCQSCGQVLRPSFPDFIEYKANFNSGLNSIGGKIIITPTQLIFRAHAINLGNLNDRIFEIKDITGYKKGTLTFLYISFLNGKDIKLTVWNKDEIIDQLEERRRTLICNSKIGKPTQGNVCPHCGASVNEGDAFCENCGGNIDVDSSVPINNYQIPYQTEESSQNMFILPIVIGVLMVALIGGGWWYYNTSKQKPSGSVIANNDSNVAKNDDLGPIDSMINMTAEEEVMDSVICDSIAVVNDDFQYADAAIETIDDEVTEDDGNDVAVTEKPSKVETNKVFDIVEQMPSFPGGDEALMRFLNSNVHYPTVAEENGIQGRVVVTFVVECDGSITDVKVAVSVDPSLDKEAVRVIKSMPRWKPGTQDGKPVRVKFTTPVTFRLQ